MGKKRGGSVSGSSVGCQGMGGSVGRRRDGSLGSRRRWTSVLGEGVLGLSRGEVDSVAGDQPWEREKKRCCGKEALLHNYKPEG